jgi:hypothetical protein
MTRVIALGRRKSFRGVARSHEEVGLERRSKEARTEPRDGADVRGEDARGEERSADGERACPPHHRQEDRRERPTERRVLADEAKRGGDLSGERFALEAR